MELRDRILKEADDLFCKFGVKRITMDDIAKQLGMSKKTIYQHFKDKNELVHVLVQDLCQRDMRCLDLNAEKASNAIEQVFLIVTHLQEMLSKMNPMIFYDLQKYHPETWALMKTFRYSYMRDSLLMNLKWGIEEGYFRAELNVELIATLRIEQVDMIFNQIVFPPGKYMLTDVLTEITEHFLYGLCTLKGHKLINKYKQLTEE